MASPGQNLDKYPRRFGKYHLLGPLAQGGMGALYLAVTGDRGLERLMVIKTVLPHLADNEYVARFRDEAKVVVKLSHGNLIPVFDAGQVGGELFLAMDFVEGRDLRAVWNRCAKKQVAFPIDIAVYIVKELCRGLAYAHAFPDLELVHRDISPPNVLISYTGEVKLTDFGLASSTLKLEKTAPGIIYGKVAYMSPEQARGERLDGRSDQYASAIVLWELLTGRQLFPPGKEQPQDLLARARNPEVLKPSKRAPRVPGELDDIVVRGLSASREDRYTTCDEMQKALQGWLAANAPTTDSSRMSEFIQDLFSEDIAADRIEREAMMNNLRKRAMTLPPTDELRQILDKSGDYQTADTASATAVRSPNSIGRRAIDRGDQGNDRRQQPGERRALGKGGRLHGGAATAQQPELEPDDSQPIIGHVIDGRYRVVELIGEGGMGKVYLAEHVEIGKRVALKVLHPSYSRMPDLVERFRREARAASKIGHPNIVDVTDSGTTADGSAYFVMEYLEGVELGSVIEREGALELARAIRIAQQMCRALTGAHSAGIIHRDLKPENVFLTIRDGNADFVKVLDFGIAKTTEAEDLRERRLTSPGMAMGTPEYMAPEQAAGRQADARCDIYALGAILYEMLTGVPPYQGDNFMEILTKKATVDPVSPSHLRSTIPAQVSQLVMQAMARNPEDRPPSMDAFEYELTKCLSGRGIAVANILGMTTDQHLVASLNPGMAARVIDSGGARAHTSSPAIGLPQSGTHSLPRPGSHAALSVPMMASLPAPGTVMPSHMPVATPSSPMMAPQMTSSGGFEHAGMSFDSLSMPVQRSGLATFFWVLLAGVVLGGLGVVLFVAAGERGKNGAAGSAVSGSNDPAAAVDAGASSVLDAAPVIDRGSGGGGGKATGDRDRDGKSGGDRDGKGPASGRDRDGASGGGAASAGSGKASGKATGAGSASGAADAVDSKDAAAMLAAGDKAMKALDWPAAIEAYNKVIATKQYTGQAYLGLAKATWQNKNVDGAIVAAEKALRAGAGDEARKVLGHLYYRKQNYEEAKKYYEQVLKNDPSNEEVRRTLNSTLEKLGEKPR
jgi:serine/threonine protein kinase